MAKCPKCAKEIDHFECVVRSQTELIFDGEGHEVRTEEEDVERVYICPECFDEVTDSMDEARDILLPEQAVEG